jgi:Cellulose biosynthesis protein BcsS
MVSVSISARVSAVGAALLSFVTGPDAFAAQGAPPAAEYAGGVLIYSDVDFLKDATTIDSGATIALNGNLARQGFIVELYAGLSLYSYLNSDVPGGKVDANAPEFYGRVGYQWFMGNLRFETTIGDDVQRLNLDPSDPTNPQRGTKNGFMVAGELETNDAKPVYLDVTGEFSTANDAYWSRARLGYNLGGDFILGPEGLFIGDDTYNSQRVGGFLSFPIKLSDKSSLGVSLSGGYSYFQSVPGQNTGGPTGDNSFGGASGSGNSSYGAIAISTNF